MPKNDYVKLKIDARYLNSVTDLTNYSWPLELVQMIMTRVNGEFFSVSDLSCAYHQVPLSYETQKSTSFIIGGGQYTFTRGFYGVCGVPNFFSRLMTIHLDPLIRKKQAITYIDDTIVQSQTRGEMFFIINEHHTLLRNAGLKAARDKTFFFLKKVKFPGHVISPDGIQPIAKRVDALRNLKSPQSTRDVMKVLGCLGFYSCYFKNLHVNSQTFCDLIKDSTPFDWTEEHESLFNSIKERIHNFTVLAVPSTEYPFHIHVDSSNVDTVVFLSNNFLKERDLSRLTLVYLTKQSKKCPLFIESCVEAYQLSRHTNITLSDHHIPSISIVTINHFFIYGDARDNYRIAFFRYQVIITKFQNLKIIWTPGSNLAFPDILSRNVTVEEYQMPQLRYKRIPRDIEFYDEHGTPVTYQIQHEDNPNDTCNDFYPIKYKRGNKKQILRLQNEGKDFTVSSMLDEFPIISVQQASDCFRIGKFINQFRRICGSEPRTNASVNSSNAEYSSIGSLSPSEDDTADSISPGNDSHHLVTHSEDDDIVCDISLQSDQARLCQAKQAHDLVLGKTDASLAKKCLTAFDAPHRKTKALIQKLDEVAKTVGLDVSTILEEQMKDPVLGTVHSWIRKNTAPDTKSPEIQQSKGLLRFCQDFNRLLIEEEGQLLCYNELSDKLEEENIRICLPLSLFLSCFRLGHYNEMEGDMGAIKTYTNAKRFYYWPGMFD